MQDDLSNSSTPAAAASSYCRDGYEISDDDGLTPMSILMMRPNVSRRDNAADADVSMMSFMGFQEMNDNVEEMKRKTASQIEISKMSREDSPGSIGKMKPRDNCRVCGDIASGLHYGISSCEGCKGFFKRSVQKKREYKCRFYKNCLVNKKTRNSCQACRFHKCLSCGMNVDLVRSDRTPGNRRKRPLDDVPKPRKTSIIVSEDQLHSDTPSTSAGEPTPSPFSCKTDEKMRSTSPCSSHSSDSSSTVSDSSNVVESKSLEKSVSVDEQYNAEPSQEPSLSLGEQGKDYIKLRTQMLGTPSSMTNDKEPLPRELLIPRLPPDIHNIVTNIIKSKPNVIPVLKKPVDEAIVTSQMFMNVAYSELEFIVWFSKRQFGFNELYMNDRRQLLRNSFLAMQLVRLSFRSKESAKGKILFAKDLELSPEEALNISQFPPTIINMNLELIDWFHSLKLDEVECGLLQTIILASDDADNLMDRPLVRRIQNNHLEALRAYSNIRFPHAPHRLASLLLRLPFVRKMALLCMEHFLLLIESGQLTMDQLAVELVTSESQG